MQTRKTKYQMYFIQTLVVLFFVYFCTQLSSFEDNMSGVLSRNPSILLRLGFLFYGLWIFLQLKRIDQTMMKYVYCLSTILTICIPYQDGQLVGSLHLLCAYTLFLSIQWIVIKQLMYHKKELSLYSSFVLLCFFLCLFTMTINGYAQSIYGIGLSLFLTYRLP